MRTVTVEVEESEFEKLRALWAADVDLSHLTAERYLGLTLALGGRIRAGALQLGESSLLGRTSRGMGSGTAWGA